MNSILWIARTRIHTRTGLSQFILKITNPTIHNHTPNYHSYYNPKNFLYPIPEIQSHTELLLFQILATTNHAVFFSKSDSIVFTNLSQLTRYKFFPVMDHHLLHDPYYNFTHKNLILYLLIYNS